MNYSDRISEKRSSSFRHRLLRGSALLLFVAALTAGISTQAAPFRNLHVPFTQPDGTKIEVVASDRLAGNVSKTITIPADSIADASKILVKIYPGVFSQVLEGTEGMLRLPGG